jgi:hypothetical protein
MKKIDLADWIAALRDELEIAARKQADRPDAVDSLVPDLLVTEISIELSVDTEFSADTGGKLKFVIGEVGAKGTGKRGAGHKIQLTLKPGRSLSLGTDAEKRF